MTELNNTLTMIRHRLAHAKELGAKDIWLGLDEVVGLLNRIEQETSSPLDVVFDADNPVLVVLNRR